LSSRHTLAVVRGRLAVSPAVARWLANLEISRNVLKFQISE
jgi:hypothetical protein